ncbi:MAG: SsrA-binding protein SmpB [Verrucomicrobia bacterium]|nr:SsrA-binding protein SmpB [Verrucomicrobiota bacterium]
MGKSGQPQRARQPHLAPRAAAQLGRPSAARGNGWHGPGGHRPDRVDRGQDGLRDDRGRRRGAHEVLNTIEAGIVQHGTDVKSLRAGKGQISDAFARAEKDEVWLYNAHIDEYSHGNLQNHAPKAPRKLLLHKSEIRKLFGLASVKGNALVPIAFYWKNGKVKVLLGVGTGKQQFDKREDIKKRESDREMKRATAHTLKGR